MYDSGKRKFTGSFEFSSKANFYVRLPRLRHDKGTIGMMLSENGEKDNIDLADSVSTALHDFENAQRISIFSALKFERKLNLVERRRLIVGTEGQARMSVV